MTGLPQCLQPPHGCPPGAEPRAVVGSRRGVLVLHGFTGSPWEVAPLADALVAQGWTVAVPVLAGHATSLTALNETTWLDWRRSAEAALQWLESRCDRVDIVGFSMGGLLASILHGRQSAAHAGALALLAPAFTIGVLPRTVVTLLGHLGWPNSLGKSDPRLPNGQKMPSYMAVPLRATLSFLALQRVARQVVIPHRALVLQGDADRTVPCGPNALLVREIFGSAADVRVIAGAGHILPRTDAGPDVIAQVLAWLIAEA